jgi:hypothetical protein
MQYVQSALTILKLMFQKPGGRDLGGAKWTINGKIVCTAQADKTIGGIEEG